MWMKPRRRARREMWIRILTVGAVIGAAVAVLRSSTTHDFMRYFRMRRM